jgi:hypothetical protein
VWRGTGVVNHCSNLCIMCTLSLPNEVTRLPWHCTNKHNYAAYMLQYSKGLASIYMALRSNAVRPLGFRLPETFLQISGIISLLEWETVPLQDFLLQKITEKQKMYAYTHVPCGIWIQNASSRGRRKYTPRIGHRNWKFATGEVAGIFNK